MSLRNDRQLECIARRHKLALEDFSECGQAPRSHRPKSVPTRDVRTHGVRVYLRLGDKRASRLFFAKRHRAPSSEQHDVELLFIQPGKPTQNAFIESFNSRIRSELLNAHWFHTLAEAQANLWPPYARGSFQELPRRSDFGFELHDTCRSTQGVFS